jgi:hypothetical protein
LFEALTTTRILEAASFLPSRYVRRCAPRTARHLPPLQRCHVKRKCLGRPAQVPRCAESVRPTIFDPEIVGNRAFRGGPNCGLAEPAAADRAKSTRASTPRATNFTGGSIT